MFIYGLIYKLGWSYKKIEFNKKLQNLYFYYYKRQPMIRTSEKKIVNYRQREDELCI